MGFQVEGDRQKGSRISLFGGRQMGPRITCWLKGIAKWDSKLKEIARRDLVFRYLEVARWDLIFRLNKRNRQMGFQVEGDRQKGSRVSLFGGRQMGPRISCWLKKKKKKEKKGNRQMGFQVE